MLSSHYLPALFKKQIKASKKFLVHNPIASLTLAVLSVGVIVGGILTQSSTELRQQALVYSGCISPATLIIGGVDAGGCQCPNGGPVVNPGQICPVRATSTPMCIQDGDPVGQGGICCSGHFYQSGNNVYCGAQPVTTCLGNCISGLNCGAVGRYQAQGNCGANGLICCGGSLAYSPTPTPNSGVGGPSVCSGYCLVASNCSQLNRVSLLGNCANQGALCCGDAISTTTPAAGCIADTCSGGYWCGHDSLLTLTRCYAGQTSCQHIVNNTCASFSPTPKPTSTPICITGNYRCANNTQYYCFGGSESATSCGAQGCDVNGRRCAQAVATLTPTPIVTPLSCNLANGTILDRDLNTYCCNHQVHVGACQSDVLASEGQFCTINTNCQAGLICDAGVCKQCRANSCISKQGNYVWCGRDSKYTTISCQPGQNKCEFFSSGSCLDFTPTPTSPSGVGCRVGSQDCGPGFVCKKDIDNSFACAAFTPTPITPTSAAGMSCRQNSDCGFGYTCQKDPDNTLACRPATKDRYCYAYNFVSQTCEPFLSFSGIPCPDGTSPNSDICIHPTITPITSNVSCIPGQEVSNNSFCVGNTSVSCLPNHQTQYQACSGSCNIALGVCMMPPFGQACLNGVQWCSTTQANVLLSCENNSPIEHLCPYGCDIADNRCNYNPSELRYVDVLRNEIEDTYHVSVSYSSAANDPSIYDTLVALNSVLHQLPPLFTDQVKTAYVYPIEETSDALGYTYMNGDIAIQQCTVGALNCEFVVTHEIAHNTEELVVTSPFCAQTIPPCVVQDGFTYCPDAGDTCSALDGFIAAAGSDEHPLIFNADNSINMERSEIEGITSQSTETSNEYFANYMAFYLQFPNQLHTAHPEIYQFFQDMYHYYP